MPNTEDQRFDSISVIVNKMPKRFVNNLTIKSLILIVICFFIPGCGRKALPRPPSLENVAAVNDLSGDTEGDLLELTWTVPPKKETAQRGPTGFIVYRSKIPLSDSYCAKCPKLFKPVADIIIEKEFPFNRKGHEKIYNKMKYFEELKEGYRYTYKVNAYIRKGIESKDSNFVNITIVE